MDSQSLWPVESSLTHRLFLFFEHPLFWGPIGIVGGLVGLFFYTPILVLCGACVLLAFHRAGVVSGARLRTQIMAYSIVAVISGASLYGLRVLIQKHAPDIGQEIAQQVAEIIKREKKSEKTETTTTEPPKVENPPAVKKQPPSLIVQPNLRERGLRLSQEIGLFLRNRETKAPKDMPYPTYSSVGGQPLPDTTPPYMKETASLFANQFESKIIDVRDAFSARGLQSPKLGSIPEHLSEMFGNTHATIQEIATSIRKLALLTPPDDLYKNVSNERLYQMAMDVATNAEAKAKTAADKIYVPQANANAERYFFYSDFRECCLSQIEYLRAEIIRRVGPGAIDTEEMRDFNGFGGITELEAYPSGSISAVLRYVPEFKKLAQHLKDIHAAS